jgi:hypothetical protein
MKRIVLTLASLAAIGLLTPLITSAKAEDGVSVRIGEHREYHRDYDRGHRRVVFMHRDHDRGYHRGWREHRAEGSRVIIRRGHDRDRD